MRRLVTLAAAALVPLPAMAQAAEPPCLTVPEFTALSTYALPSLITGMAQRCSASLPASAYLRRDGASLASRYSTAKPAAWPGAKAALLKIAPAKPEIAGALRTLPDETLREIADTMIVAAIADKLPADRCTTVDRALSLLSPLPAENTASLIALAVGFGAQAGRAKLGGVSVCPA